MGKQRFEKGFKELTLEKQRTFFKGAFQEQCLDKSISWIPNDIKELQFKSDNKHIHTFLEKFKDLKQLETLYLDFGNDLFSQFDGTPHLRGATYRPAAAKNLIAMTEQLKIRSETIIVSQDIVYHSNGGYTDYDASGLIQTFVMLRKRVIENPNLNWNVHFQDLSLRGKGREISNVSNLGSGMNAEPAINYIKA